MLWLRGNQSCSSEEWASIAVLHWDHSSQRQRNLTRWPALPGGGVVASSSFPRKSLWGERTWGWVSHKKLPSDPRQWDHGSPSRALKARKAESMGGGWGKSGWIPPHGEQKPSCSVLPAAEPGKRLPFWNSMKIELHTVREEGVEGSPSKWQSGRIPGQVHC